MTNAAAMNGMTGSGAESMGERANRPERLRPGRWFVDREVYLRSQGTVRFLRLTARAQLGMAIVTGAALLATIVALALLAWNSGIAASERADLLAREARVAGAEARLSAVRGDIVTLRRDLEQRQGFLEDMVAALPDDAAPAADASGPAANVPDTGAAGRAERISAAVPEAAGLANLKARQTALAGRLARFAEARADRAEGELRQLGLDPAAMLSENRAAMGGPLRRYPPSSHDPLFARLGHSLARMNTLTQGLAGVPRVLPASYAQLSSGFGYRSDPFSGEGAMHSGLDFRGPVGAPVHAASRGTVSFVGQKAGYGNVVEISHGNGLLTRYAHLSAFQAVPGRTVAAGAVIGAIGNTGRSTGPHLHFEVRIHDRPVNPRPFLERAPDVFQETRRSGLRLHP